LGGGALGIIALVTASGCGFGSSPANGLQFHPPAGWRSSPGFMGFIQFWRPPTDDREVLMLFKSPKQLQPSDIFSDARLHDTLKNVTVERRSSILICGNQPARYVEARGSSARGEQDRVDMVMTNAAGSTYFAMYVRPVTSPTNPMAEAALQELCAKP
jgi:hypothetical protein